MEDDIFHTARQHHSGVESAISALQTGNGQHGWFALTSDIRITSWK